MIAVDTNILLRYLLNDDPVQSELARLFFEDARRREEPAWISHIVLVEMAWVLRHGHGVSSAAIVNTVRDFLDSGSIVMDRPDVVAAALVIDVPDLADALIHAAAVAEGCFSTITFDGRFARHPGVELLA